MAKYEDISNWLREKIIDGTFATHEKIPSEKELAAKFGYSRQTVRQAIRTLEMEGLLTRMQGSGTYVNRCMARLSQIATMRIGVVTAYFDDYVLPGVIRGIEDVLSGQHYTITLSITHNRQTDEENVLQQILANGVDGLIVEGTKSALPNANELLYREILNRGLPVVFLNSYYHNFKESYVVMDDVLAGRLSTKALTEKGHTQIGGIFKSDDMQGIKRYEGMREELREEQITLPEGKILWYTTEDLPYLFSGGLDSLILARFSGMTGLICYNDQIATEMVKLFSRHGISVPGDISIVSFDNSPLAGMAAGGLTSVTYPSKEIGHLAAELLLKKLSSPSCRDCVILTPEIERRASIRDIRPA